jgi:hypothetical protein
MKYKLVANDSGILIMAEPMTTALIVGLAAQKFAEGAAGKAAEKLVERLWESIVARFKGKKKTAENLAAIEAAKGDAPAAIAAVTTVLDGEFVEDEDFQKALVAIVEEIRSVEPERVQKMLVGIKTTKGIKGKDLKQTSTGAADQAMLTDVEAESLEFENLTQEQ